MPEHNFSQVEAVVIEPNLGTTRESLNQLGLRKVHSFPTLNGLTEALAAQPPDLVLIDVDSPEINGFKLIRWLRIDPTFPNPFLCIVATSWQPTEELLRKVHNSGADTLLVKPASPKQILDRLHALLDNRKRFTVSADYIGPDRRKNPREGQPIPTLEAPNTFRLHVTGQWEKTAARDLIAKGTAWLNEQKAQRDAFQIAFYIEVAKTGLTALPPERLAHDLVLKVSALVEDLLKRVAGREHDLRLETACRALLALVERIRRAPELAVVDSEIGQLHSLSLNLMRAVNPGRTIDTMMKDVAEAAAGYQKRLDQILAAKAEAAAAAAAKGEEPGKPLP